MAAGGDRARLVKQTALKAGIRSDLPEADCAALFAGHFLRAGLASSAEIDAVHVKRQFGQASVEMTRRYQRRRERFRSTSPRHRGCEPPGPQGH